MCTDNIGEGCYMWGNQSGISDEESIKWLTRACDLSDANGCHDLGNKFLGYYDDQSGPMVLDYTNLIKDLKTAVSFYDKACTLAGPESDSCASLESWGAFDVTRTHRYLCNVESSHDDCSEDYSYGLNENGLWVDAGCNATFKLGYE